MFFVDLLKISRHFDFTARQIFFDASYDRSALKKKLDKTTILSYTKQNVANGIKKFYIVFLIFFIRP